MWNFPTTPLPCGGRENRLWGSGAVQSVIWCLLTEREGVSGGILFGITVEVYKYVAICKMLIVKPAERSIDHQRTAGPDKLCNVYYHYYVLSYPSVPKV
jgi:hypothetical protein